MYFNFTYWYQLILPTSLTRLQPNDWVEPSPPQDAKQEWLDGGVKKIESLWGGQAGCEIFWIEKNVFFPQQKVENPKLSSKLNWSFCCFRGETNVEIVCPNFTKPPKSSSEECFPMSAWTCFPPKMGMSRFRHRNKMRWLWCVPKIWSYYKVIKSFLVDMVVTLILDLPYTFMVMVCPYGSPGLPLWIFHRASSARPRRVAWARRSSSSTWAFRLHFNPLWLEKVQPEL